MKKLRFPKIKYNLSVTLWVVFCAVVIIEGWVLYENLYVNFQAKSNATMQPLDFKKLDFDITTFNKIRFWLNSRQEFMPHAYTTKNPEFGRVNPFADY